MQSSFFLVYPYLVGKKVLDIGCSDGLYLRLFSVGSCGIEQVDQLVSRAQSLGCNVIHSDIETALMQIQDAAYEAAFFSHVLEHMKCPISVLFQINRVLAPGSMLILGLPTEKNFFRWVFRKNYFNGTHLYSFSVDNSIKLLNLTGFEPMKVIYDLPRCRGRLGRALITAYQCLPFKEQISMAYWVVAKKSRN